MLRYCKESLKKDFNLTSIEGKSRYAREFLSILAKISSPIEEEEYIREIATELGITVEALRQERQRLTRSAKGSTSLGKAAAGAASEGRTATAVEESASLHKIDAAFDVASDHPGSVRGRERSEAIVLAVALSDPIAAEKLVAALKPQQFDESGLRHMAEVCWPALQKGIGIKGEAGLNPSAEDSTLSQALGNGLSEEVASDPEIAAALARLSFVASDLGLERDQAFRESLDYLKRMQMIDELNRLQIRSEELRLAGDSNAVDAVVSRMQELQLILAAERRKHG